MYQIYNLVQLASGIGTPGHGGPWPQKKVTRRLGLQTSLLLQGPFGKDPFKGDHRQAPFHLAGPVPVPWTPDTGFQVLPGHTMVPLTSLPPSPHLTCRAECSLPSRQGAHAELRVKSPSGCFLSGRFSSYTLRGCHRLFCSFAEP